MKTMIKKATGLVLSPSDFRELNYCIQCGKMTDCLVNKKCSECLDLVPCEMCEVLLHDGERKFYSYDTKEQKRDEDLIQYTSKQSIREFLEIEIESNKFSETLCKSCVGWEKRVKDVCFLCDNDFKNSREHYKLNGNMCPECATQFQ